jgi:hypothetical protein
VNLAQGMLKSLLERKSDTMEPPIQRQETIPLQNELLQGVS